MNRYLTKHAFLAIFVVGLSLLSLLKGIHITSTFISDLLMDRKLQQFFLCIIRMSVSMLLCTMLRQLPSECTMFMIELPLILLQTPKRTLLSPANTSTLVTVDASIFHHLYLHRHALVNIIPTMDEDTPGKKSVMTMPP